MILIWSVGPRTSGVRAAGMMLSGCGSNIRDEDVEVLIIVRDLRFRAESGLTIGHGAELPESRDRLRVTPHLIVVTAIDHGLFFRPHRSCDRGTRGGRRRSRGRRVRRRRCSCLGGCGCASRLEKCEESEAQRHACTEAWLGCVSHVRQRHEANGLIRTRNSPVASGCGCCSGDRAFIARNPYDPRALPVSAELSESSSVRFRNTCTKNGRRHLAGGSVLPIS